MKISANDVHPLISMSTRHGRIQHEITECLMKRAFQLSGASDNEELKFFRSMMKVVPIMYFVDHDWIYTRWILHIERAHYYIMRLSETINATREGPKDVVALPSCPFFHLINEQQETTPDDKFKGNSLHQKLPCSIPYIYNTKKTPDQFPPMVL